MYGLMARFPVMLPLGMVCMNITSLVMGMVAEGRIREGAFKFMFYYASTIPAAARGDLSPFIMVLSQPG